jgi:hypothetical protein
MASAPVIISSTGRPGFLGTFGPSHARALWLAFVLVQALDGVMSYVGVSLHGPSIEGNPLVGWYLAAFGPAVGFTVAKLFAVTCGAILYMTARYRWVAILTVIYLIFAVGPWARLLTAGI